MKRLCIFIIAAIMIFQAAACQPKEKKEVLSAASSNVTKTEGKNIYKEDYLEACKLIAKKYIYLESKMNKSREEFLSECIAYADTVDWSRGKTQFIAEIRKLRAKFPDGHFGWSLDRENWLNNKGKYLGFTLTVGENGKVYVGKVYPYFTDKLSVGDEIIKWNGQDVKKELVRIGNILPQSTKGAADEKAAKYMTLEFPNQPIRDELKPVTVTYRGKDGSEAEAVFEWKDCGATAQLESFIEKEDSNIILLTNGSLPSLEDIPADSKYVNKSLPFYIREAGSKKYVVLHPRDFSDWTVEDIDKTFGEILKQSPDVLIVDLKDSAGGYFDQALYLSHALNVNKSFSFFYDMIDSETDARTTGTDNFDNIAKDIKLKNVWKGKVIFRINSVTVSAGDFFSRWMQLSKRGLIIGTPSAGAGAGTSDFTLHNTKTEISIPMRDRRITEDSKGIEGNPVMPDEIYYGDLMDFIKAYENKK